MTASGTLVFVLATVRTLVAGAECAPAELIAKTRPTAAAAAAAPNLNALIFGTFVLLSGGGNTWKRRAPGKSEGLSGP
jgi:hypothetical protein